LDEPESKRTKFGEFNLEEPFLSEEYIPEAE
jgi:hypothetical protein